MRGSKIGAGILGEEMGGGMAITIRFSNIIVVYIQRLRKEVRADRETERQASAT